MKPIRSAEDFAAAFNVSRETTGKLITYESILQKWNEKINLVGRQSLALIWQRHFADSAQIFGLAKHRNGIWADLGSGAGFPGLVVAIIAQELAQELRVILVESDVRKCAFLTTAANAIAQKVEIIAKRAESLPPLNANTLSARAFAPLLTIYPLLKQHLSVDGEALLLKGASVDSELTAAQRIWNSSVEKIPSATDPVGVVLRIGDIDRA